MSDDDIGDAIGDDVVGGDADVDQVGAAHIHTSAKLNTGVEQVRPFPRFSCSYPYPNIWISLLSLIFFYHNISSL